MRELEEWGNIDQTTGQRKCSERLPSACSAAFHWRFIMLVMVYVKFAWWKASVIGMAISCCGRTLKEEVREQNNKLWFQCWFGSQWTIELIYAFCWMIYTYFHSGFHRICFGRVTTHLFLQVNSSSSDVWTWCIFYVFVTWLQIFQVSTKIKILVWAWGNLSM